MPTHLIEINGEKFIDYHPEIILTPRKCNSTVFKNTNIDANSNIPLLTFLNPKYKNMSHAIKTAKELLKQNSGWGKMTDKWAECLSLFFDVASHCYEKGECNPEWGFRVGIYGNLIETDSINYQTLSEMQYNELLEMGNYLHRLCNIFQAKGLSY